MSHACLQNELQLSLKSTVHPVSRKSLSITCHQALVANSSLPMNAPNMMGFEQEYAHMQRTAAILASQDLCHNKICITNLIICTVKQEKKRKSGTNFFYGP